ncbi:MAG: hypothetical protein AB2604_14170 [Candidatus Thiodiazotropha taylori]
MSEPITIAVIGAIGVVAGAIAPNIYKSLISRKSNAPVRDITGRWIGKEERGEEVRTHVLHIEKQIGREFEGTRILKGAGLPTRKYRMKGFFTGDLVSGSIVDDDPKESRILSFLLRVHKSDLMKGKLLLWKDEHHIQASNEMEFLREET